MRGGHDEELVFHVGKLLSIHELFEEDIVQQLGATFLMARGLWVGLSVVGLSTRNTRRPSWA
jgi:hypothetical protein